MTVPYLYDVFLSHSSKDKLVVRDFAERLKAEGLRVWLDEWVIRPGDSIPVAIEKGLETSRTLLLFMSDNAFSSEWVTLERHTAIFSDPTNRERRFIPVRLDDHAIKDVLRQFAYIDWRSKDDAELEKLVRRIRANDSCSGIEGHPPEAESSSSSQSLVPVTTFAAEAQSITSACAVNDALARTMDSALRLGCTGAMCSLVVSHGASQWLVSRAAAGRHWEEDVASITRRELGGGDILSFVAQKRAAVYVPNAALDLRCDQHTVRSGKVVSFYAIPLFDHASRVIGVLQLDLGDRSEQTALSYRERSILDTLGVMVGASLSHSMQAQELALSRKLDQALLECRQVGESKAAISWFLGRVVSELGASGAFVRRAVSAQALSLIAGCGHFHESIDSVELAETSWSGISYVRRRPFIVNEATYDATAVRRLDLNLESRVSQPAPRIRSHATVPIFNGDLSDVIGVVQVDSESPWFFDESRVRSLNDIANRLSVLLRDYQKELPPSSNFATNAKHRTKIRRNHPCPCGSGRKYKKCCAKKRD